MSRSFAFRISNRTNEYVLSAMTSGIRTSWIQAIGKSADALTNIPSRSDLPLSSLDSTSNNVMSWRSLPASDSDADFDMKSKDSASSWSPLHSVVPAPSSFPGVDVVPSRTRITSTRPYRLPSTTSTTFAGHGSNAEDLTGNHSRNTPDLLDRVHSGGHSINTRQESRPLNTRLNDHSFSTDVGLNPLQNHDAVDGYLHFIGHRTGAYGSSQLYSQNTDYTRDRESKFNRDLLSAKKDVASGTQFRAPSAKVMERTRAKSPKRSRSPPPTIPGPSTTPGLVESPDGRRHSAETWQQALPRAQLGTGDGSLVELMKYEVTALRQQLDATRAQLEEAQSANSALHSTLMKATQDNQSIAETLESEKNNYHFQMNHLTVKLSETTSLLETQNVELLELRNKNQQLVERERGKLEKERLELELLRQELSDKNSLVPRLEAESKALRKELREKEAETEQLDRKWVEKFENAKGRWIVERETVEMQAKEMEMRLNQVVRQSETANVESRNATNILKDREEALIQLEEQLVEAEKKLQCAQRELEMEMEDNTRIHKELDEYCKENATLKMLLSAESEKSADLEADVRHVRAEKQELLSVTSEKDTKNALLRQDVERVENQLKEAKEENVRLKDEMKRNDDSNGKHRMEELNKLRAELDNKVSENKTMAKRLEDAKRDESVAKNKISELEERLSKNVAVLPPGELQKLMQENSDRQNEVVSLKDMLERISAESEEKVRRCEETIVDKEKRILQLQCEYGELIEQQKNLKREVVQSRSKAQTLEVELTNVKSDHKAKCDELKQSEAKLKTAQRQLEARNAMAERSKSVERVEGGMAEGKVDESSDKDLKEKYAATLRQVKQLQVEKQQAETRSSDLELANKQLKQDQRSSEVSHAEEKEQLSQKVQELTTRLTQLERRNHRLEQRSRSEDDGSDGSKVEVNIPDVGTDALEKLKIENDRLASQNKELLDQLKMKTNNAENDSVDRKPKFSVDEREELISQKEEALARVTKELEDLKSDLEGRENEHVEEIQAVREGYEMQIRTLENDLSMGRSDHARSIEEKDQDLMHYERELSQMETKLESIQSNHDSANADLYDEMKGYKSRIRHLESELQLAYSELEETRSGEKDSNDDQELTALQEEADQLRELLKEVQRKHAMELSQLKNDPDIDPAQAAEIDAHLRIRELEEQIQNMKYDYEHELQMQRASHRRELMNSKEDVMQLLATAEANSIPIDEESIRKKYMKEVEQIKEIYDKGVSNMEKSHQRTMMEMRRNHKMELDRLQQDKDQLLKEEAQATQAALEAMRKVHESELQAERNKFLDLFAKTFSHADMETLQRQHEEDLELLRYDMKQLTEKFTVKCLENAALDDRLISVTKSLHENRKRVQDLLARNDELNSQLKFKIERLGRTVSLQMTKVDLEKDADAEKPDAEMQLEIKQMEVLQLQEELENSKLALNVKTEELKESMERYHDLCDKFLTTKRKSDRGSYMPTEGDAQQLRKSFEKSDTKDSFDLMQEEGIESMDIGDSSQDAELSSLLESTAASDFNTGRRSLWRFKNPQRARSNPSISTPTALQMRLQADSEQQKISPSHSSTASTSDDPESAE